MSADKKNNSTGDDSVVDETGLAETEGQAAETAAKDTSQVVLEGNLFDAESMRAMAEAKLIDGPDDGVLTLKSDGSFTFEPGATAEEGEFFSFIFKYQFVNEDGETVTREAVLSGTATEFGISSAEDIQKLAKQLRVQLEDQADLNLILSVLGKDAESGEEIELAQFLQELVLATRQNQSFEFVEFTFANRLTNDVPVEDLLEAIQAGLAEVPEGVEVVDNSNETEAVEITGTSGDDIIVAGSGGDTVAYEVGQGNDTVDGGDGFDLVSVDLSALDDSTDVSAPAGPVNVSISAVNGNVVLDGGDFELTLNGVEEILLTGGDAGGTFVIGDLTGTDIADDTIILVAGQGAVNVTNNSDRSLEVRSSGENDTVVGGSSTDLLVGLEGNDSLVGNAGNDTLVGGSGRDTLQGGSGDDVLEYSSGDHFDGGAGNDTLRVLSNTVNVAQLLQSSFSNIENIELVGERANLFTIDFASAATLLGNGQNSLRVAGDSQDTVFLTSNDWSESTDASGDRVFTLQQVVGGQTVSRSFTLEVAQGVQVVLTSETERPTFPGLPTEPQNGPAFEFKEIVDPSALFASALSFDSPVVEAGLSVGLGFAPGLGEVSGGLSSFNKALDVVGKVINAFSETPSTRAITVSMPSP